MSINPSIHKSWKDVLEHEFQSNYFLDLKRFLLAEKGNYQIYPPGPKIFEAFNLTPFEEVKVVILGQDPYHGDGQAHGLSFSVPPGIKQPPSLQNIFKEIHADLGLPIPKHGNLEKWAKQGVFLLNAILTVRANQPASHQNHGWETFTDAVIKTISNKKTGVVFLLWGRFAQNKVSLIDTTKHYILKAPHPSPFSAHTGFLGCKHFSKTNEILKSVGEKPIDWGV